MTGATNQSASFVLVVNSFLKTFKDSELNLLASSLTFFTILAIVPFLSISLSVASSFGGLERFVENWTLTLIKYLTVGSGEQIVSQIESAVINFNSQAIGVISYIILVLTSTRLLKLIDQSIQRIWHVEVKRKNALKSIFRIAFVFLAVPSLALALGALISIAPNFFVKLPSEIYSLAVLFPLLFSVYKIIPNKTVNIMGSLISALVIAFILSLSPQVYVWVNASFLDYNKVYGSLAFLPLFLIWIFVLWVFVLFGVALNVWLEDLAKIMRLKKNENSAI